MAINIIGNDNNSYGLIKEGLKAANTRTKMIANNMANVNTANYKRFSVVFEDNLKGTNKSELALKKTNVGHMSNGYMDGHISVVRDTGTSMREDGNNVDLDVEKVEQAANTLKYNALITQANTKLSNMRYVISGGN